MPYTPPAGSAANFTLTGVAFPREYNALFFRQGGTYSAPIGSALAARLLPEYVPPIGSAANFVEAYSGPTTISLRAGATNRWGAADRKINALSSAHPATKIEDQSRGAPWLPSSGLNATKGAAWIAPTFADSENDLPFGAYGEMLNEERGSVWKPSKSVDDQRNALWSIFGEMLNEGRGSRWVTSIPTDHRKTGAWRGHFITHRRIVPFQRPVAGAVDFAVMGGGITSIGESSGYTPPLGNAIHFTFGNVPYIAPFMVPARDFPYTAPKGDAASFFYNPAYELLLDGTGQPVLDKATADRAEVCPWGVAAKRDRDSDHPWTMYSRPLNPGWGIPSPGAPTPVPGGSVIIPVQRVYIVINEIQLLRVSSSTPLPALNLSISFDCDSWLPTFSANIPESSRAAVMPDPDPVEIEAVINGTQFRFFVEKISRNRAFAQKTVSISGRGIACELDAPYAVASQHTNTSAMTAQQIITAALGYSGYTQTWGITDWLVPADTFSLYGTAAQVAGSVAEASGSVLAADWSLRDLRLLPRYPVKPWDWATVTPDYVIPGAIAQTESLEWIEKPAYNVVYVSGVQTGVLGQVKITGTAGDLPAPMVTHPLITHADAARQRGISILGDTGRKAMLQISLPVLESTGIIDVCKLIEFNDGTTARRGLVRANNISVNWPTVRQTLTVEAAA